MNSENEKITDDDIKKIVNTLDGNTSNGNTSNNGTTKEGTSNNSTSNNGESTSKANRKYYVYMLCESDNKPFYIGKGTGDRIFNHEKDAEKEIEEEKKQIENQVKKEMKLTADELKNNIIAQNRIKSECEKIEEEITAKYKKINDIGIGNVKKVIVKWGLTKDEAFMAESSLINAYVLTNGRKSLTNIINGHRSIPEKKNRSCETKARTVECFLRECAAEDMLITKLNDIPVMFVKIGASYPECKDLPDDKQEEAIYQCARGAWKIGKNVQKHLDKIQYVFALYNSIVVGIYPVDKNSWIARKDITADYDFPEYPFKIRKIEREYTLALAKCNDEEEVKEICNARGLDFDEFKQILNNEDFKSWSKRMFFKSTDDKNIPENVSAFLNNELKIPDGKEPRKLEQNEQYNFKIVKNQIKINQYNKTSEE